MKSKSRILLHPTEDVLEVNMEVTDFFRLLSTLKESPHYQPKVSLWDEESNDWTSWHDTETEIPNKPSKRKGKK